MLLSMGAHSEAVESFKKLVKNYYDVGDDKADKQHVVDTLKKMEENFNKPIIFKSADDGMKHDFEDIVMAEKMAASALSSGIANSTAKRRE